MINVATRRTVFAAAIVISGLAFGPTSASAASSSVERACASDYFAYCSQHDPESSGVRRCMRANGSKLSQRCLNALAAAGEVSKSEVRSASKR